MERIKITSGTLGGRAILSPQSNLTHPMGAREKLALFNMINNYLPGARVLDAFAGSGALGIEALSRGASEVVWVEKNAKSAQIIRQNLADLGLEGEVFREDVANFTTNKQFDVVLADPPYDDFAVDKVERLARLLSPAGILVLSHPGEAPELSGLERQKTHQYARAHLSLYVKR